ncbi:DUF417 family protein [Aggregatibacter aphrophilus]|jgi:hypothetical protein|uniref:DUF417 family protein n=1 Tax=Aggregatibacter aphrophilus TaxID=732 RepID=UPI0009F44267|nr:DUF417 family protein [Aggregatibacter aphrophilus]PNL93335.1 DUF417 domain-containing protein [Aggregatibacter aphrophilus]RDE93079.1 DUF417 family protein [Aggregatibacter aphrophilus]SQI98033.1 Predicted membrane protein [Aggregatibacter aphrophilus]
MKEFVRKFCFSDVDVVLLRFSVVFIIALFGNYKWFDFEVEALKPLISSTWLNFLYDYLGFYGTSYLLGAIESINYIFLTIGFFKPKFGVLGSLFTISLGVVTLSLIPQIGLNSFIVKDIILIGSGLVLLKYDLKKTLLSK